jgi:hypothetical protein
MTEKRKQLTEWLVKELGSPEKVKEFSQLLRELQLCDLRSDKHFNAVTDDGAAVLMTFITWYQFGFLHKLKEIKNKIGE